MIIFGALAIFMIRRRKLPGENIPACLREAGASLRRRQAGLWLRFSVLFFLCALLMIAFGVLLAPFGFFWLALAGGLTLFLIARLAPRILNPR